MTGEPATNAPPRHDEDGFGSNDIRLAPREWLVAGALFAVLLVITPAAWQAVEPLESGPDYRVPYALADDYWLYHRNCRRACAEDKVLLVGDSVVWGHYVASGGTLSRFLNDRSGGPRYANLGLDGTHPAALAGLVEFYGGAIRNKNVLLVCNPLWISSPRHDLQADDAGGGQQFNHPRLVPQFAPRAPCYRAPLEERLGIVIQRRIPFLNWTSHLRAACFDNQDLAAWAGEHPYENPLRRLARPLPSSAASPEESEESWTARRVPQFNPPWVELDRSYQWAALRRTIALLQARGNRVFVLVGPFNEPMLKPPSLQRYQRLKAEIAAWLAEQGIPHYVPAALPSELYADASHPLAAGYRVLAEWLYQSKAFVAWVEDGQPASARRVATTRW